MINQLTNFEYEIIVLDDCSTDNTRDIIDTFEKLYPQKIRKVYQTENQFQKGVPVVNQIFYPLARGKYVAYCEGDDYWTNENKLQIQVDFLENNHDYVAYTHECWEVDENENQISDYYFNGCYKKHYDLKVHCSLQILSGQTATIMHKKEAFCIENEKVLKDLGELKITGDIKKTAILVVNGPIYHDSHVMSHHRRVYSKGDSWSAQTSDRNLRIFYFDALDELSEFINTHFGMNISYEKFKIKMTATSFYLMVLRKEKLETLKYMYDSLIGTKNLHIKLGVMLVQLPFIRMQIRNNREKARKLRANGFVSEKER